jgi:hypothetical protein
MYTYRVSRGFRVPCPNRLIGRGERHDDPLPRQAAHYCLESEVGGGASHPPHRRHTVYGRPTRKRRNSGWQAAAPRTDENRGRGTSSGPRAWGTLTRSCCPGPSRRARGARGSIRGGKTGWGGGTTPTRVSEAAAEFTLAAASGRATSYISNQSIPFFHP